MNPVRAEGVSPGEGAPSDRGAPRAPPLRLSAGIVAYNEERGIEESIRSLLVQRLPEGVAWDRVWVVASGCTDQTVARVEAIERTHPLVRLVVEPDRGGKSRALDAIFRRAEGSGLVLLNADATAEPGSVAALLRAAEGRRRPFAVMGRPVVAAPGDGTTVRLMRLQWELHHELHRELIDRGVGNHVSDELLLVSLPELRGIPAGIVNDGAYFGAWLTAVGGEIGYAPAARVRVAIPSRIGEHVRQRRRIRAGHRQVASAFGRSPTTLPSYAREDPAAALSLVARTVRDHPGGWTDFGLLGAAEIGAALSAAWDRFRGAPDPVGWRRVETLAALPVEPRASPPPRDLPESARIEARVRGLLAVAARFGTGVPLDELVRLLPVGPEVGPRNVPDLQRWLSVRPRLARVESGCAVAPGLGAPTGTARRERGAQYREAARTVVERAWARWLPLVEVIALTGSAAYGEPEAGDDLDLFVVVRRGALWIFLPLAFLSLRLHPPRGPDGQRLEPCLNTALDTAAAGREFGRPKDLLFAREALALEPLVGRDRYRALLDRAEWMHGVLPRLYVRPEPGSAAPRAVPAPPALRIANLLLYPLVAAYLQMRGLAQNRASLRAGAPVDALFRTITEPGRMTLSSRKFDRIRSLLEGTPSSAAPPERAGDAGTPKDLPGAAFRPRAGDAAGPRGPTAPLNEPAWSPWGRPRGGPDEAGLE